MRQSYPCDAAGQSPLQKIRPAQPQPCKFGFSGITAAMRFRSFFCDDGSPPSTNPLRVTICAASTVRITLEIESAVDGAAAPITLPLCAETSFAVDQVCGCAEGIAVAI